MNARRQLAILTILTILGSIYLSASPSFGATTSTGSTINVGLTVPGGSGGGGPGPGGDTSGGDTAPVIGTVVVTPSYTSAVAEWGVTDDKGIASVQFEYGTSASYGTTATVMGGYRSDLSGLQNKTEYFYKVTAVDTSGKTATVTGSFTTLDPVVQPDITPPALSAPVVDIGMTTATISWTTNEPANAQVRYGESNLYGNTVPPSGALATAHSITLTGLSPNTLYHYQVESTDSVGNSAASVNATFTTTKDNLPPSTVTNVSVTSGASSLTLSWTNPLDTDLSGVRIVRRAGSSPTSMTDGVVVYTGSGTGFVDTNGLVQGVVYHYAIYTFDTSLNYSVGAALAQGSLSSIQPPTSEICGNNIDDDGNGAVDCADTACSLVPECSISATTTPKSEVCGNGVDDDANGQTDCVDSACVAFPACGTTQPETPTYNPPGTTVGGLQKLYINDLTFSGANGTIVLSVSSGAVSTLAGTSFGVVLPAVRLAGEAESVTIIVDGENRYQLGFSRGTSNYVVDFPFPRVGSHTAHLEVRYQNGAVDVVTIPLLSQAGGVVTGNNKVIEGATVTLLAESGAAVDTTRFGQANPLSTDANGLYGWVVPNGRYALRVERAGFYARATPVFSVNNNVINQAITLVVEPKKLVDIIDKDATLSENIANVAVNLLDKSKALGERSVQKIADVKVVIDEIANDPEAQKIAGRVVAPSVVGVTALGTFSFITFSNLLPFLRFLFLQPLMLLGLRRRSGWGQVYNTLNKLPIDLATVRLVNAETGKVVQSRVTDRRGRYAFIASPGRYHIEVTKGSFVFPSALMIGYKNDGRHTDVYHGEDITVTEDDAVITANIPLDPIGENKMPTRLVWQKIGRSTQIFVSWLGLFTTVASLYVSRRWYVWVLLGVHVLLFIIFRRLAVPPKIKSWGIVYDTATKHPVGRTVARLFNSEFNKLVSTQITDSRGRYYFLAGDNKYYVTYDHPEYASEKTEIIDLSGKEADNIAKDVALKKQDEISTPPASKAADPQASPGQTVMAKSNTEVQSADVTNQT